MVINNNSEKMVSLYQSNQNTINQDVVQKILNHRDGALAALRTKGIPTAEMEDYKRCDVNSIFDKEFILPNCNYSDFEILKEQLKKCTIPGLDSTKVVIYNDVFSKKNSVGLEDLPLGTFIGSLKDFLLQYPDRIDDVNRIYSRFAKSLIDGTIALNTLYTRDALVIYIPKEIHLDHPIEIVHYLESDKSIFLTPRLLFIVDDGAKADVIISNHTFSNINFIINRVIEIEVGRNANFKFIDIQKDHVPIDFITTTITRQYEDSNLSCAVFNLGDGVSRNNIRSRFIGENGDLQLLGLGIGRHNYLFDNFTRVEHTKPYCHTDELYKYILNDRSVGSFAGRIFISQSAQKTLAYQQNRNLLLSREAKAFGKPQLEIYADDVHCSHGLTTGQLDDEILFYMQQRGIPSEIAKIMLSVAFADNVIEKLENPALKSWLHSIINDRFHHSRVKIAE